MLHLLHALLGTARSSLKRQRALAVENLALQQQLAILRREPARLALPTQRSSVPFCHGLRNVVRLGLT
jgi:hypothetical protein